MAITHFKRKEIKYRLSEAQADALMQRVSHRLLPSEFFFSEINNLYLDTADYQLIRASIAKPVYKEKLRIRSYGNAADSGVFYEIKKKYKGVVYKRRFRVGSDQLEDAGSYPLQFYPEQFEKDAQTVKEWNYCEWLYPDLQPRYYVGYDRHAYVGAEDAEFRVTLDRNLRWRNHDLTLTDNRDGTDLLQNDVLMEIKVPGAMPLWMSAALSELSIFPVSFSKIGEAYTHDKKDALLAYVV
ncbi:MAG: VTC domain-containing protein [Peptoniphilaceae bacterium]|jgi:SPX domain protein involved in polyphosphate accumulation|nr:polyphosphate polymerase domain-containing protein [Bacillota bacterium]